MSGLDEMRTAVSLLKAPRDIQRLHRKMVDDAPFPDAYIPPHHYPATGKPWSNHKEKTA